MIEEIIARSMAEEETPTINQKCAGSEIGIRDLRRADGGRNAVTREDAETAERRFESGLTISLVVAEIGSSPGTMGAS